ncbi:MAG: hypothetical protein HOQ02_04630 [Lysobacter sp.]|nr:hypothetical protein [Lysobacter sp.]
MKCLYCGCTDRQACPSGCYWAAPEICSTCAAAPRAVVPGQLWRDVDGNARVFGVVRVDQVLYAVLARTRGKNAPRGRRPFIFPVESLRRGDDGWQRQQEQGRG